MSPVTELLESIIDMPREIIEVASQGPVEALLVLVGAVFIVVPSVIMAYLVLGAGVDLVTPDSTTATHPEK